MTSAIEHGDDRPRSPCEAEEDLVWKPSSGEGSAAALDKLHRAERVKTVWRQVRSDPRGGPKRDGPSPS
jgi:hypothetical protein